MTSVAKAQDSNLDNTLIFAKFQCRVDFRLLDAPRELLWKLATSHHHPYHPRTQGSRASVSPPCNPGLPNSLQLPERVRHSNPKYQEEVALHLWGSP
eukprot:CAMPEP_0169412944 /NCGR_PEP_ID=MMETSP1017-20121227/61093_1 /TAXON_ID=342587 /ORGANISM="Karlodinium micrum, Strain CCMP2283" /LENGTH=96 /DNA_ID=CAMNT_0009520327 /DNA_START=330 /DNA_END=616 /DNA_ORIENTATION=-